MMPCAALIKSAEHFSEDFDRLAWDSRHNSTEKWYFIGGMNNTRHVHIHHVHIDNPKKYDIDWRGFLVIRDVSMDDEMEYRCLAWKAPFQDPEASFVFLSIRINTGKRLYSPDKN